MPRCAGPAFPGSGSGRRGGRDFVEEVFAALEGDLEDEVGAVGADAVLDDGFEGVEEAEEQGAEAACVDFADEGAGFAVGLLDAGEFVVSVAETAAAEGELRALLFVGEDPLAKRRNHGLAPKEKDRLWAVLFCFYPISIEYQV